MSPILLLLFGLICYLFFQDWRIKKRLAIFFKRGETNVEEILSSHIKTLDNQAGDLKKIFGEVEKLNNISTICFQRIGVVRFNPFKDVGGDQSFSIALLDAKNNGVVITGLYTKEGNRIFAKPISGGQSKYLLSEEEREAITKAIG
jgi:hypothetical protein